MCAQVRCRVFGRSGRAPRCRLAVLRRTTAAGSGEARSLSNAFSRAPGLAGARLGERLSDTGQQLRTHQHLFMADSDMDTDGVVVTTSV